MKKIHPIIQVISSTILILGTIILLAITCSCSAPIKVTDNNPLDLEVVWCDSEYIYIYNPYNTAEICVIPNHYNELIYTGTFMVLLDEFRTVHSTLNLKRYATISKY